MNELVENMKTGLITSVRAIHSSRTIQIVLMSVLCPVSVTAYICSGDKKNNNIIHVDLVAAGDDWWNFFGTKYSQARHNILVLSCQFESVTPHAIHFHCCAIEKVALLDRMNPENFHFQRMKRGNGYFFFRVLNEIYVVAMDADCINDLWQD